MGVNCFWGQIVSGGFLYWGHFVSAGFCLKWFVDGRLMALWFLSGAFDSIPLKLKVLCAILISLPKFN